MHPSPHPSHGFFRVTVAFGCYVLLVVGFALVLQRLGLSQGLLVAGTLVAAVALFAAFLPLFRRLTPRRAGDS